MCPGRGVLGVLGSFMVPVRIGVARNDEESLVRELGLFSLDPEV